MNSVSENSSISEKGRVHQAALRDVDEQAVMLQCPDAMESSSIAITAGSYREELRRLRKQQIYDALSHVITRKTSPSPIQ
jgi:hypothetical protein